MNRITIPEIRLHPWFQHKLPPYLRHPPELMEKQERVVDQQIIDEVMHQPFQRPIPRQTVEMASSLEATQLVGEIPKLIKDIRVVYELLLDHKHTRLRVMEVARAIREAASATPPAFSPGGSRSGTPGGHHSVLSNHSYGSYDKHATSGLKTAEEAARALMMTTSGSSAQGASNSSPYNTQLSSSVHSGPVALGQSSPSQTIQMQSSIPGNIGIIQQLSAGANSRRARRWYLGIQSKKDPAHVMSEVYRALSALNCEWMQMSSYRIKCRWRPNIPRSSPHVGFIGRSGRSGMNLGMANETISETDVEMSMAEENGGVNESHIKSANGSVSTRGKMTVVTKMSEENMGIPDLCVADYTVKISLSLYKVQQSIYLLDFQKMTGDAFSFMTLCSNIITELKTLSAASKQQQALLAQQHAARQAELQRIQQQQEQQNAMNRN